MPNGIGYELSPGQGPLAPTAAERRQAPASRALSGRIDVEAEERRALVAAEAEKAELGLAPATTLIQKANRRQHLIRKAAQHGVPPQVLAQQIMVEGVQEEAPAGPTIETPYGELPAAIAHKYLPKEGAPAARKITKDVAGQQRFVDTGERVFPGVEKPAKPLTAKEKAIEGKAAKRMENAKVKIATGLRKVDEAMEQAEGWFATGPIAQFSSWVDSSSAGQLKNTLMTIKGILGFSELRELKESSPTGGALGQVSTFELENLQSVIAALKEGMPETQLKANLKQVKFHFDNLQANLNLGNMIMQNPELEEKINAAKNIVNEAGSPKFTPAQIFQRLQAAGAR